MKTDYRQLQFALGFAMASLILISSAQATGNPPHLTQQAMGAVMSRGVVSDPLRENTYQGKVSFSSVTNNSADSSCAGCTSSNSFTFTNDMKGDGFAATLTYGFSNHWGVSVLAGYTNISGTRSLSLRDNNGALIVTPPTRMVTSGNADAADGNVNGAVGKGKGYVATVNAIWDYREEGDQFHLPIMLGVGVMSVSEEADSTVYQIKRTADFISPTVLVGIAPAIATENFSTAFFFMMEVALNSGTGTIEDYRLNTKTEFSLAGGHDSAFPIAGVEFSYRPWNLGFSYTPDLTREGARSIGVKWSSEWGGKK